MASVASTYRAAVNQAQRDNLIMDNLDFVRKILGKTVAELPKNIDIDNLEAAGILGLVEAADNFDVTRGVAFQTFAYRRIRGAILDELRRNSPLPQRMMALVAMVSKASRELTPPATPEAIAEASGLSLDDVESALAAMRLRKISLWEDSSEFLSGFCDSHNTTPESVVEQQEQQRLLAEAITQLPEKERLVITMYYLEDLKLREIGEVLSLSESRISRLLSKAEFRLSQLIRTAGG